MEKTWNVSIFIEEDGVAASARARLTGGNAMGHVVGNGRCHVTPTAVQDAGQRAVVMALKDLSHQLDRFVAPTRRSDLTDAVPVKSQGRSRHS